jgi:hypothetical protein
MFHTLWQGEIVFERIKFDCSVKNYPSLLANRVRPQDATGPSVQFTINLSTIFFSILPSKQPKRVNRRTTPLGVVGCKFQPQSLSVAHFLTCAVSRSTVIYFVIERSLVRFWERRHSFCPSSVLFAIVLMMVAFFFGGIFGLTKTCPFSSIQR